LEAVMMKTWPPTWLVNAVSDAIADNLNGASPTWADDVARAAIEAYERTVDKNIDKHLDRL
jgi:hypothetical protein